MRREIKITSFFLLILVGLYMWGEYSAFKILKKESGHSWDATGNNHQSVHHK